MVRPVDHGERRGPASGVLQEAFQITGRGCVGVFAELEGIVRVGDTARFPDGELKVTGIEIIRYTDPTKRPEGEIGVLLEGAEKEALLAFKGKRIVFEAGED
ncbi:hypothetical protein [Gymnodinialimonas hymeniacidonis]|uniref:hypothetical protein n=1 Tax=Gymnodinialimonas hymeniacidonis TaxID=3126508 RepID=UPI0034C6D569